MISLTLCSISIIRVYKTSLYRTHLDTHARTRTLIEVVEHLLYHLNTTIFPCKNLNLHDLTECGPTNSLRWSVPKQYHGASAISQVYCSPTRISIYSLHEILTLILICYWQPVPCKTYTVFIIFVFFSSARTQEREETNK